MDFHGRFKSASKEWESGKWLVTFTCDNESDLYELEELKDAELDITAKKHRNKRSLDANAYAWVLMQKISEKVHKSKWEVYLDLLQEYSRAFTFLIVKPKAVEKVMQMYRTCIDHGDITVNGQTGHQLQVFFGSSTFDTKEMSVFLDGVISTAQDLNIPTETPAEIERMKAAWDANKKN